VVVARNVPPDVTDVAASKLSSITRGGIADDLGLVQLADRDRSLHPLQVLGAQLGQTLGADVAG
jgi:hypothetical protein